MIKKNSTNQKIDSLKKYRLKLLKNYFELATNYSGVLEEKEKLKEEIGDKEYLVHFGDLIKSLHSKQRQERYASKINSSLENMKEVISELEEKLKEVISISSNS